MVTCVAEPKSGSQEVGTRSNPDLMEGKMFRGEGGNGLTLRKLFVFLFELLFFSNSLERRYGSCLLFLFLSSGASLSIFLEDDPYSIIIVFEREHCLDGPFEMDRLTIEVQLL